MPADPAARVREIAAQFCAPNDRHGQFDSMVAALTAFAREVAREEREQFGAVAFRAGWNARSSYWEDLSQKDDDRLYAESYDEFLAAALRPRPEPTP